jgi:hypothetical protein
MENAPDIVLGDSSKHSDKDIEYAIMHSINNVIHEYGASFLDRKKMIILYNLVYSNKITLTATSKINIFEAMLSYDSDVFSVATQFIALYYPRECNAISNRTSIPQVDVYKILAGMYSSFDPNVSISRVNTAILNCKEISVQEIVNIYEVLFDRISVLFINTLIDTSIIKPDTNPSKVKDILLAIFTIVENMPKDKISKVLAHYSMSLKQENFFQGVVYDITDISPKRFPRLYQCIHSHINMGTQFPTYSLFK